MLDEHTIDRPASRALPRTGMSMAINKDKIEMTTNNSTRVKPNFNRLCSGTLIYLFRLGTCAILFNQCAILEKILMSKWGPQSPNVLLMIILKSADPCNVRCQILYQFGDTQQASNLGSVGAGY